MNYEQKAALIEAKRDLKQARQAYEADRTEQNLGNLMDSDFTVTALEEQYGVRPSGGC